MKIQKTIIGCVAIAAIVAGCETLKSGNVANAGKSVGVDIATSAVQSATTSARGSGRQGSDANERYIQILKREDDVNRIFAAAAQIDYSKCSKAIVLLRVAYEKTSGRRGNEVEKQRIADRVKATGNLDLFKAICKEQDARGNTLIFHQEVLYVAREAVEKANPTPATKEDYQKLFTKMTPQQIAQAIYTADHPKSNSTFNVYIMSKALTWEKGFDVMDILAHNKTLHVSNRDVWDNMHENVYASICQLPSQEVVKQVAGKLPKKSEWLDRGYNKGTRFYEKVIEQITDPAIAEYLLSRDLHLKYRFGDLIAKLSQAKKAELVSAAKKRAETIKDKIVIEGFYLGMPYRDLAVLADAMKLNVPVEKGSARKLIDYTVEDLDDYKDISVGDCEVNYIMFRSKGWVKFLDCEDKDILPTIIHKYVKKKSGKATKLDYLLEIQSEMGDNGGLFDVYKSTKLSTKISVGKTGAVELIEIK